MTVVDTTTSAPEGHTPYAGAVTRLGAYVIDISAMSIMLTVGSGVAAYLIAVVTGHELHVHHDRVWAEIALVIWWVVYFAGCWATVGRTPGMAVFGLRGTRADGSRATIGPSVVRAVVFPLSVLLFGLGFLGILFHAQRRALHDLIAGTAVIYDPAPAPAA